MGVVDLTPDPNLLLQIGLTQESAAHYIADLIDNAIDARGDQPARVDITIAADRIVIRDYGEGMTEEQLRDALVLGRTGKDERSLGAYGFGMKSAMSALGRVSTITTAARGSGKIWQVIFDPQSMARRRGARRWQLEYTEIDEPGFGHGTRIEIQQPQVATDDAAIIRDLGDKLSHIYGALIRSGTLLINLNGKPLPAPALDLAYGPEPLELFVYGLDGTEHRITGWVGITEKPRRVGQYGFDLMWRGRVIVPYDRLGRRPHTSWNRLVGALNLDTFMPTQNKNDFLRDTPLFRQLQSTIWGGMLNPILARVEDLNAVRRQKRLEESFARKQKALGQRLGSPETLAQIRDLLLARAQRTDSVPERLQLLCEMANLGNAAGPYVDSAEAAEGMLTVQIRFNLDHQLFRSDPRNVVKWMPGAAVDALALRLADVDGSGRLDPTLLSAVRQHLQFVLSAVSADKEEKRGRSALAG